MLVKDFVSNGVDGIWNDMNEPAIFKVKIQLQISFPHVIPFLNCYAILHAGCDKDNARKQRAQGRS